MNLKAEYNNLYFLSRTPNIRIYYKIYVSNPHQNEPKGLTPKC